MPDHNRPGILRGVLSRRGVGTENYQLRQYLSGWVFCQLQAGNSDQCWQVAEAESGSLEGGRAFIDVDAGRLRISVLGQEGERLIFEGNRTGCD